MEVRALGKFNDRFVYILSDIDVFSKLLHLVHQMSKTGTAGSSAFQSILKEPRYFRRRRSPALLRTDKGKEFFKMHFQDMLKLEGIQL